jgi:SAM-dependent methyltransferase
MHAQSGVDLMSRRKDRPTKQAPYHDVVLNRLLHRSAVSGQISIPAAPGMIDDYVAMCESLFTELGRPFTDEQMAKVRRILADKLAEAYEASPRSRIIISYDAPVGPTVNYNIRSAWASLEATYESWVENRKPPLFGKHPDARVMALAEEVADPATHHVLDLGAGTGRNTLPLARRGHLVDAVELTPKFADIIRDEAQKEFLDVRVITRDVFATLDDLRRDYGLIVLSEVVSDFRTTEQLRGVLELAAECLAPGGRLVFNGFLTRFGYTPDSGTREVGLQVYTGMFTPEELDEALAGLGLHVVSNDSAYDYEKAHLPEGAWPQTGWFETWASGRDLFNSLKREECPIELRWLVLEKAAAWPFRASPGKND